MLLLKVLKAWRRTIFRRTDYMSSGAHASYLGDIPPRSQDRVYIFACDSWFRWRYILQQCCLMAQNALYCSSHLDRVSSSQIYQFSRMFPSALGDASSLSLLVFCKDWMWFFSALCRLVSSYVRRTLQIAHLPRVTLAVIFLKKYRSRKSVSVSRLISNVTCISSVEQIEENSPKVNC